MPKRVDIKYPLFYFAAFIITVAGLKAASEIVVILFLSIFISSIFSALLQYLSSHKIPKFSAYIIILFIFAGILTLLFYIVSTSLSSFIANLPSYEASFKNLLLSVIGQLENYNINLQKEEVIKNVNFSELFKFTTNIISNVGSILSKLILVFIGVAFILSESDKFSLKIEKLANEDEERIHNIRQFSKNIQRYFIIKALTSFATGFFIFIALILFDIEYPLLWGVVGFLFNFVPVIGSIVASIPAVLLSLFQGDIYVVIWIVLFYLVINVSISNIIEPKFMGDGLGLSTAVIFFSLIFWGYILGIAGMFLAVPITMTLKMALDSTHSTQWLSEFLSKK